MSELLLDTHDDAPGAPLLGVLAGGAILGYSAAFMCLIAGSTLLMALAVLAGVGAVGMLGLAILINFTRKRDAARPVQDHRPLGEAHWHQAQSA